MAESSARTVPPELEFDHERATRESVRFLQHRLEVSGLETYVLGLSGGVDSACAAALAVRAVGPERLVTVKMPSRTSSLASRADAEVVEDVLGIPIQHRLLVEVAPMVEGWQAAVGDDGRDLLRRGNVAARSRMIVLWDRAAAYRGIVLGTENRTENLLGYFTIYGDAGSAVEPIAGLFKCQIWSLASYLGVPAQIVEKPPTADLWTGQTDEGELGARYADADRVLHAAVDLGIPEADIANRLQLPPEVVGRVLDRYRMTAFKRELPYRHDTPVLAGR
ncbi:MAG: NAD+ synthase [Chloroflexota bacterium]